MRDAHARRLLRTSIAMFGAYGLSYLLPLLALPYIVRVIGAENFGVVSFANAFVQYLIILTDYGFNLSASREIAIRRGDRRALQDIYSAVIAIKLLLCLIAAGVLLVSIATVPSFGAVAPVFLCTFGLVIGQALQPSWFLQGVERQTQGALINLAGKALGFGALLLLLQRPQDFLWVPAINSLAQLLIAGAGIAYIRRSFGLLPGRPCRAAMRAHLRHSTHYFASRVAVSLYTSSSTFVLGLVLPYAAVGRYAMADTLYRALQGPCNMLAAAIAPHMAHARDLRLFERLCGPLILLNTAGCALAWVLAPWITALLFGAEGAGSAEVLRPLLIGLVFVVPSILVGYPCLAALGDERWANNSVILGAAVHASLLVAMYFAGRITPEAVAWAVAATECCVFLVRYVRLCQLRAQLAQGAVETPAPVPLQALP